MSCCCRSYLAYSRVANSPRRIIDDAPESLFVVRIYHHPEVCDNVFYLFALIETQAAINTIRNVLLQHFVLESTALCIRSVEDGEVVVCAAFLLHEPLDFVAHNRCLLAVAVCILQDDAVTFVVFAIDIFRNLPLILLNQTVGCLYNALSATVVLLKLEQFCPLEHILKVEDVVDIGTPEGIDALGIIAHNAYVLVLLRQLVDNPLLHRIGVLILVNENELEALCIFPADILVLAEERIGHREQVVEIHRISLLATHLVDTINLC